MQLRLLEAPPVWSNGNYYELCATFDCPPKEVPTTRGSVGYIETTNAMIYGLSHLSKNKPSDTKQNQIELIVPDIRSSKKTLQL